MLFRFLLVFRLSIDNEMQQKSTRNVVKGKTEEKLVEVFVVSQ